ncbi:MAG: hypothetical protein GKR89_01350 [Candidatus Latescibacteria bacterium]|nr:hypothetical protein [Candidatus Latescibacterota bacterium]
MNQYKGYALGINESGYLEATSLYGPAKILYFRDLQDACRGIDIVESKLRQPCSALRPAVELNN